MSDTKFKSWLARQAYSLLLRLGTPAYLWRIWSRGRQEPVYREAWPERLGFHGTAYRQAWQAGERRPVLWLHAVSLGEARAATPLVKALRAQRPDMRLLLTHGTATGREAGKALLAPGDMQTWCPFDTPGAVRRFLTLHRPDIGVLMETEVWPNIQHEAHRMGVPMVLANARLSEKSLRQGRRFGALLGPAARALSLALAQTPDDARRLGEMGVPRVQVCGNVKFDMAPPADLLALGRTWAQASDRPIVLAASTREGEEPGLIVAWRQALRTPAWQTLPQTPRLWIVPRHPQRFEEVAALIRAEGWRLSRRSAWPQGVPDADALAADVWLGDSMGEMPAYYASAQVALLGGSFAPLGGQNLIEAAACGCPLIMGPSTFNFADAAEWSLAAGASMRVQDWDEAVNRIVTFCDPNIRAHHAAAAQAFARSHQGAAALMAENIWSLPVSKG